MSGAEGNKIALHKRPVVNS